jgi:hypothetical protein
MKMRRGSEDVSLAADLTGRLAAYACEEGIHCRGCGSWLAVEENQVPFWGYDRRGDPRKLLPYCNACAGLGLVAR